MNGIQIFFMAITLIPYKRRRGQGFPELKRLFSSYRQFVPAVAVLVVVAVLYFGANIFHASLSSQIEELTQDKEALLAVVGGEQIEEVQIFAQRVVALESIIFDHTKITRLFSEIENSIHNGVTISRLDVNIENNTAAVSGVAPTFEVLGEQYNIWRNSSSYVRSVDLDTFAKTSEGQIDFSAFIKFDRGFSRELSNR